MGKKSCPSEGAVMSLRKEQKQRRMGAGQKRRPRILTGSELQRSGKLP